MISIIIPTYNDTTEIENIIDKCNSLKFEKEIIVIDDGSTQKHKDILSKLKNIELITHKTNFGKSQAMLTGLKNSNGNIIVFLDADIINLETKNLEKLIIPVMKNNYDITMSEKGAGLSKYGRYLGIAQTFTGERTFRKDLLLENLDIFESHGYTIEAEMNKRFFNKYKIGRTYWPNVENPSKIRHGSFNGLTNDIKMYSDIKKHIGIKELTSQIKTAITLPTTNPEDRKKHIDKDKIKEIMEKEISLEKLLKIISD